MSTKKIDENCGKIFDWYVVGNCPILAIIAMLWISRKDPIFDSVYESRIDILRFVIVEVQVQQHIMMVSFSLMFFSPAANLMNPWYQSAIFLKECLRFEYCDDPKGLLTKYLLPLLFWQPPYQF